MTTRRGFFRILAGAAIAPVISAEVAKAGRAVPYLWGDGVHDDTEALQALFDGKIVEFSPEIPTAHLGWFGDTLHLPDNKFLIRETIRITSRCLPKGDSQICVDQLSLVVSYGVSPAVFIDGVPDEINVHFSRLCAYPVEGAGIAWRPFS